MNNLGEGFTVVKNKRNVNKKHFVYENQNENDIKNLQKKIYSPKVDLISCLDYFKIRIELPGVQENTVNIELKEQQIVLISGTRTSLISLNEETDKVIYSEAKYGNFTRRVKLPELVEPPTDYNIVDGVLYVQFKKKSNKTFFELGTGNWSDMV